MNFWQELKKKNPQGIMVLAPMADVTDPAFRRIIAKYGKPDVIWTEFVSADGLFLGGFEHLVKDLAFSEEERPIVAQFSCTLHLSPLGRLFFLVVVLSSHFPFLQLPD
jgi:tRNA-dihydrouridine synthase